MKTLSPKQLITATYPGSRWQVRTFEHQPSLYTPLLGNFFTIKLHQSPSITIKSQNRANQYSPNAKFVIKINNGNWSSFYAGHPFTISLPETAIVTIMTGGNCDLDQVWKNHQGFALTGIEIADKAQWQPIVTVPQVTVIGDSITAGCWVGGKHASIDYHPESNYIGIASRELQMPIGRIAYSAAGFLRSGTGQVPPAIHWLTHIDTQATCPLPTSQWIIVNLGVNDRQFSSHEFLLAAQTYFSQLKKHFNGQIAILIPFAQAFASELHQLGSDLNYPVIETAGLLTSTTDGLHPDQDGSISLGKHFANALQNLLEGEN